MILIGAWLIQEFHLVLYIFGAFLLITGIKMLVFAQSEAKSRKQSGAALDATAHQSHHQIRWRKVLD